MDYKVPLAVFYPEDEDGYEDVKPFLLVKGVLLRTDTDLNGDIRAAEEIGRDTTGFQQGLINVSLFIPDSALLDGPQPDKPVLSKAPMANMRVECFWKGVQATLVAGPHITVEKLQRTRETLITTEAIVRLILKTAGARIAVNPTRTYAKIADVGPMIEEFQKSLALTTPAVKTLTDNLNAIAANPNLTGALQKIKDNVMASFTATKEYEENIRIVKEVTTNLNGITTLHENTRNRK